MKKFLSVLLAAALTFAMSVVSLASTPEHDDPNCVLDNVEFTVEGTKYVSDGEKAIRLDAGVPSFTFDAVANIVHEKKCDEQRSGSSVVNVYYKINKGSFVKVSSSSNPGGRTDISFDDVTVPKSGSLATGDLVTIEFRYDNESGGSELNGDTVVTFYVYVGDHSGQPLTSGSSATTTTTTTTTATTTTAATGTASAGSDENPNTGLVLFPAALALIPAALLSFKRKK